MSECMKSEPEADGLPALQRPSPTGVGSVLDAFRHPFICLDADSRVVYLNAAAERLLAQRPAEVLGVRLREVQPELASPAFEAACAQATRGEQAPPFETHCPSHTAWYEVHVHRWADGLCVYFQDITGRLRAEAEARRRGALLEQSYDAVMVWELGGRITRWKPSAEALYGYNALEAIGADVHELLRTQSMDAVPLDGVLRRVVSEGRWEGVLRHRAKSGAEVVVDSRQVLLESEHGVREVLETNRDATARIRSQDELRRTERHLRATLDELEAFVAVLTPEGVLTFVNRAALRAAGLQSDDVIGHPLVEMPWLRDPAERRKVEHAIACGLTGEPSRFDLHAQVADDRTVVLDFSLAPVRDDDGVVTHLVSSAIDISDRVRATEAVRASEERFRALAEFIPQFVWSATPEGRPDYFNQRWYDYTGLARTEPQRVDWTLCLHPDDRARASELWQRSLATGEPYEVEYRCRQAATGEYRWFIGRALPVRDPAGTIVRWFGTCTDVHAERTALEALDLSEERYRAISRATNDVIWDLDLVHEQAWWSDALAKVFALDERAMQSVEAWGRRIHADDRKRVLEGFRRAIAERASSWSDEYRLLCGDGRIATVLDRGTILYDRSGTPVRMVGSIMDLTDRNRMEAELRQAQKMEAVGKLAGGVAHDFNNILTVITSYSELMLHELSPNDPLRADLLEVRRAADSASALTRQLLAFSRRQRLQPRLVDLNVVVSDLQKMLGRLIGEDIHLHVSAGELPAIVRADPGQLEQVIVNLVVNARDAMPDGGELSVATARVERAAPRPGVAGETPPGDYIQLTVRDTGVGIQPDALPQIFEPFFTTKSIGAGTGLGLSTVYGIVSQSEGFIEVETVPGHGTEFRILLLPCSGDEEDYRQKPADQTRRSLSGNETILLVEDESALRAVGRRVLSRHGYRVLEAADGLEALRALERHGDEIQLVITDLIMPNMGGSELAECIAQLGLRPSVLLMSGYSEEEIRRRTAIAPGTDFLEKPFTVEALAASVRSLLDARQTERSATSRAPAKPTA